MERGWGILASGMIMAIFLYFAKDLNFFLAGTCSVLVYALSLWIFRSVKASEITSIISKKGIKEYEPR